MSEKILNYLLIVLSVFLIVNYFTSSKTAQQEVKDVIQLTAAKSYTVPADVKLTLTNKTSTGFTFDSCKDLMIKKDSNEIIHAECGVKTIASGSSMVIDFWKSYEKFFDAGEYFAVLKANGKDVMTQFEVEHRGFFGKFFVFFFYAPIYNLMAYLLELTHYSLGFAIIIVTVIIRLVLLIPQHKMMVSQRKMQLIQPKVKEIQEKYKWDNATLGMELMKLYKEEKVNPMGSCGLLLIQMPILLVIYNVIVGIQDYSKNYYLYSFLSDYKIESINHIFYGFDLFQVGGLKGLALALAVAFLQFLQMKLSLSYNKVEETLPKVIEKKPDSNDYQSMMPDPEMMNKFMLYGMPVMIGFATYTFFAWVGLYWGIGTLFMIVQQLIVNKILKK